MLHCPLIVTALADVAVDISTTIEDPNNRGTVPCEEKALRQEDRKHRDVIVVTNEDGCHKSTVRTQEGGRGSKGTLMCQATTAARNRGGCARTCTWFMCMFVSCCTETMIHSE